MSTCVIWTTECPGKQYWLSSQFDFGWCTIVIATTISLYCHVNMYVYHCPTSDTAIWLLASLLYTQIWLCQNISDSPHVDCCLATTLIQNENPMKVVLWDHACFGNDTPPKKLMKVTHLTHYGLATACTHAVVTYDRGHKTVISCPLGMIRFKSSCSPPLWIVSQVKLKQTLWTLVYRVIYIEGLWR